MVQTSDYYSDRAKALAALAPHPPAELLPEVLSEVLTAARAIENRSDRAKALAALAPHLSEDYLQQGLEELLEFLPNCERRTSLSAVSAFIPFLSDLEGPEGLQVVRRAITNTARWFP